MRALITGANSHVNKVLLQKLIDLGYDSVAHYHSDNALTAELRKLDGVTLLQGNLDTKEGVEKFIADAKAAGPFDVIVNATACFMEGSGPDAQKTYDTWQTVFSVDTIAAGLIMADADTLVNDDGVIVNISSIMGLSNFGSPQLTIYSACKAALDSLTATYAKRWAPRIRITGIAPAYIRSAWNKDMDAATHAYLLRDHLTQRFVEPEEIADLMETVIKNPSINATTIAIDGGYSAPPIPAKAA